MKVASTSAAMSPSTKTVNFSKDMSTTSEDQEAGDNSPALWTGGESPAPVRNPSPPREILGLTDNIGGTAFSKPWLFSTLMKLIQVIEKPGSGLRIGTKPSEGTSSDPDSVKENKPAQPFSGYKNVEEEDGESDSAKPVIDDTTIQSTNPTKVSVDVLTSSGVKRGDDGDQQLINISDELQDELCQLWDMSSDENVAKLLQEFKAIDILTEVISKSDAPRATEIAVGILGNMACTASVCEGMADCKSLVELSLRLLTNSDALTLVECTRFLSTVLSNEKCKDVWLKAWNSNTQYQENIIFILSSSVNKDLLANTAALLDNLLDISDELCDSWSSTGLLTSITEALKQLGLSVEEGVYSLLHCLQLMSTQSNGVSAIVDQVELVTDILVDFLQNICEDEIVNLKGTRAAGVASVISVLNIILTSSPAGYSMLYSGEKFIRCILKIIYACDKEVITTGTPKSSPSRTRGNSYLIKTLKDTSHHIIADTVSLMNTEESDISQTDEKEDRLSVKTTPSILRYMNHDCERQRLNSVVNLLLSHEGREVINDILNLCDKYKLDRLEQLILEFGDSNE